MIVDTTQDKTLTVKLTEWERDAIVSAISIELKELSEKLHWRTFKPAKHRELIEKMKSMDF